MPINLSVYFSIIVVYIYYLISISKLCFFV